MKNMTKVPAYFQVAYEIACKIKDYKILEGDKIKGRSITASEFNVSTETVRRAISLLANHEILEVKENSGSFVLSRDKAIKYINLHRNEFVVKNRFTTLKDLLDESRDVNRRITNQIKQLEKGIGVNRNVLPIDTFEVRITSNLNCIGKKLVDLKLYENTGGTVFGVIRNETIISSPSPELVVEVDDVLFIAGNLAVKEKTLSLFSENLS